jgi:hypothetical protein
MRPRRVAFDLPGRDGEITAVHSGTVQESTVQESTVQESTVVEIRAAVAQ